MKVSSAAILLVSLGVSTVNAMNAVKNDENNYMYHNCSKMEQFVL